MVYLIAPLSICQDLSTALHLAAKNTDYDLVRKLLDHGANIHAADQVLYCYLLLACLLNTLLTRTLNPHLPSPSME
jgi:ankyrin repeat protein